MQTLRFADPATVTQYPLPIADEADWQQAAKGGWEVAVPLPLLEPGTILTPSLAMLGAPDYRFRFVLRSPQTDYPLRPVPSEASDRDSAGPGDRSVKTAIDCYHIERRLEGCQLHVHLENADEPSRYLLSVSIRPTELDITPPALLPRLRTPPPPTISQMLANPRIASRICSPISTAMVLRTHCRSVDETAVTAACLDPVTGMYGLWPLAIRCASRYGLIGAVELMADWSPVLACLSAGMPVVASIRYDAGGLPGAPQRATGGHLVVVWGTDGDAVLVNDPAAPFAGSVTRRYPLAEFSQAWFRRRGAAYILSP